MMNNHETHSFGDDGLLDAGLRAAFQPATHASLQPSGGVLATLDETVGPCSRVLLRDDADEPAPLVLPHQKDRSAAPALSPKYQVIGELARGGMGVIMKGRDVDLGREVAVKILRDEHRNNRSMTQRFVEEAQIAGQLQHPGILPVYELGLYEERTPYFTMKLVKGRTLASQLNERSGAADDRQRFLAVFEQICQTVGYAHSRGVIHRDLKPSNVMVGSFGEVQVVDWGLAKVLIRGGSADDRTVERIDHDETVVQTVRSDEPSSASIAGSVMGTPAYMSPEQALGETDRLDERSDVFSLGAMLCEILTGRPPYVGDRATMIRQAQEADLDGARERLKGSGADRELVDLSLRCLSTDPKKRPRDGGTLALEISAYRASLETRAREAELEAARSKAVAAHERRARRLTLGLGASVLLALIVGAGGWFAVRKERDEQIRIRSELVDEAVTRATESLGAALAAQVGKREPWTTVHTHLDQVRNLIDQGELETGTQQRADALIDRVAIAERDRQFVEKIEEAVIIGATHEDRASWLRMEQELRDAFVAFGIDLNKLAPQETALLISQSELAPQLTDALELWMGTRGYLSAMGEDRFPIEDTKLWLEALYAADPDPVAGKVRRLVYSGKPSAADARTLVESIDFTVARSRTLSWLALACHNAGAHNLTHSAYERALRLYPDDFMLSFDYAYLLANISDWQGAVRYYERCLAIRPQSAGIWRSLGIALRNTGWLEASHNAIMRSIEFQPDHAPTYVDLGLTYEAQGDTEAARSSYRRALSLDPDLVKAQSLLDKLDKAYNEPEDQ